MVRQVTDTSISRYNCDIRLYQILLIDRNRKDFALSRSCPKDHDSTFTFLQRRVSLWCQLSLVVLEMVLWIQQTGDENVPTHYWHRRGYFNSNSAADWWGRVYCFSTQRLRQKWRTKRCSTSCQCCADIFGSPSTSTKCIDVLYFQHGVKFGRGELPFFSFLQII